MVEQIKCYCGHTDYCDCGPLEEPKQETTAKEFYDEHYSDDTVVIMKDYAKMLTDGMYSKEDLKEAFRGGNKTSWIKTNSFEEWFEQYKKIQNGKSKIK